MKNLFGKYRNSILGYAFQLMYIFFSGPEIEDLKRELVKCELRNEELLTKLTAHERDILVEKREAEKVRCFYICRSTKVTTIKI
jgi:hypothetical protein